MKDISHDYYLRYVDPVVYDQILAFHTKGNFTIHDSTQKLTSLHYIADRQMDTLTGNQLKLYPGTPLITLTDASKAIESDLYRNESCEHFVDKPIGFDTIKTIFTPLLSKKTYSYKRGYPSAGALYPVEIFVCSLSERELEWPCPEKILHLLPYSRQFEVIKNTEDTAILKKAILASPGNIGTPNIALVYAAYMPKSVFKYRYRGYRHALMETGSMYMLIDLQIKKMGLQSRLWSAYTDSMLCKAIGVNPALFLPLCVQFIGLAK